jgi:lysophospholipase L1-like esterase
MSQYIQDDRSIKQIGLKTRIISDYFPGTALPIGWTDSITAWTVASNLLTGTSTSATGYNTNVLTRVVGEAQLNQQITVEKMGNHSTKAYLGLFVRRQTNGDHYLVNVAPTGLLEISRVVSGVKTNVVTPFALAGYVETNQLEITVTVKSSNSTYLSVVVTDVNGLELANVMFEETVSLAPTLQTAGTSGVSVWQNTIGGTFNTVDCRRISIFNLNSVLNIVHIGDSQTFGTGSGTNGGIIGNNYPSQLRKKLGDYTLHKNLGIGGKRASLMLTDSVTEAPANYINTATSNIAIIWAGTNDMIQYGGVGVTAIDTYNSVRNLCLAYKKIGYKVIVCTILSGKYVTNVDNFAFNQKRKDFNEQIRNNYREFADELADLGTNNKVGYDQAENSIYFADGVHCNAIGYGLCAGIIENAVYSIVTGQTKASEPIDSSILTGVIYKQFTVPATLTASTVLTSQIAIGGATGSPIIKANTLALNDYLTIEIEGRYTTTAVANPLRIDLKFGTYTLFTQTAIPLPLSVTSNAFSIIFKLKVNGLGVFPNGTISPAMFHDFTTTPTTFPGSIVLDTTIDNTFDILAQWTNNATDTIQFRNIKITKF